MTTELGRQEKIQKSEQIIRDAYYKNSEIERLANVRVSKDSDQLFLRLGRRFYIPAEWYSRNDVIYDIALNQFGEGMARSETKYILNEILKNERIERVKIETIDAHIFKQKIKDFNLEFSPTILFAPVEFFVDLSYSWLQEDPDFGQFSYNKIRILDKNYDLFWSNQYVPFNVFVFANKDYGEWLTRPSLNERFYVNIKESEKPENLELTMYTLFKFSINRPDEIRILETKSQKVQ